MGELVDSDFSYENSHQDRNPRDSSSLFLPGTRKMSSCHSIHTHWAPLRLLSLSPPRGLGLPEVLHVAPGQHSRLTGSPQEEPADMHSIYMAPLCTPLSASNCWLHKAKMSAKGHKVPPYSDTPLLTIPVTPNWASAKHVSPAAMFHLTTSS